MDLIQLTANHEKIICENAIHVNSIIQFVTHGVNISNNASLDAFYDRYEHEICCRNIPKDEKERLIRKVNKIREKAKGEGGIVSQETARYGVKQVVWDDKSTVEQTADLIAGYFGLG